MSLESIISGVASGHVEHHAPCVPECPVCYPPNALQDNESKDEE